MKPPRMNRFLINASKATSAACILCGCALFYLRRRQAIARPNAAEGDISDIDVTNLSSPVSSPKRETTFSALSNLGERILEVLWGQDTQFREDVDKAFQGVQSVAKQAAVLPEKGYLPTSEWLSYGTRKPEQTLSKCLETLAVGTKNEGFVELLLGSSLLVSLRDLLAKYSRVLDFGMHVHLAEICANLSISPDAEAFLTDTDVQNLISQWHASSSLHLNLYASKMKLNLENVRRHHGPVYTPDIFPLTHNGTLDKADAFDVIFVNGMNGSAFHTWRQHDHSDGLEDTAELTKSWPRDWLAYVFPSARILCVNANLKPFIWNPIGAVDKKKQGFEAWARDMMTQLSRAGVGDRPIFWVTHSAGGILVKLLLRLCAMEGSLPLYSSTRGIVFCSVPHRGSQALLGLHYYPFRLALTAEAKELGQDAEDLVELHKWFMEFAASRNIATMNMVETRLTRINKFWSVLLVPEDTRDSGFTEVVRIDSDHLYISKPKSHSDPIYTSLVDFIRAHGGQSTKSSDCNEQSS